MTKEEETWASFPWYCPNCGTLVVGYRNTECIAKVQCETCGVVMIRRWKGKSHDTLEIYGYNEEVPFVAESRAAPQYAGKSENPVPAKANRVSRK